MDALPPGSGKPALADPAVVATQLANAQLERLSTAWGTHKWGEEGGGGRTGTPGCAMELRTRRSAGVPKRIRTRQMHTCCFINQIQRS